MTQFMQAAAHALMVAFRFSQHTHRTDDLPIVLIPEAAWWDFLSAVLQEGSRDDRYPAPCGADAFCILSGIRFEPGATARTERDRPLTPLETPDAGAADTEWWTHPIAYAGGEKHQSRRYA